MSNESTGWDKISRGIILSVVAAWFPAIFTYLIIRNWERVGTVAGFFFILTLVCSATFLTLIVWATMDWWPIDVLRRWRQRDSGKRP